MESFSKKTLLFSLLSLLSSIVSIFVAVEIGSRFGVFFISHLLLSFLCFRIIAFVQSRFWLQFLNVIAMRLHWTRGRALLPLCFGFLCGLLFTISTSFSSRYFFCSIFPLFASSFALWCQFLCIFSLCVFVVVAVVMISKITMTHIVNK